MKNQEPRFGQLHVAILGFPSCRQCFEDVDHNYGFLHRLDVPSSGLILLARSYEAFYDLQLQLYSGWMVREYTVLCHGSLCLTRNWLDFRLFYQGSAPTKAGGRGEKSVSRLSVESLYFDASGASLTLTLWRIETGRRHQIRSQAAHVGHCTVRDRTWICSEDDDVLQSLGEFPKPEESIANP